MVYVWVKEITEKTNWNVQPINSINKNISMQGVTEW